MASGLAAWGGVGDHAGVGDPEEIRAAKDALRRGLKGVGTDDAKRGWEARAAPFVGEYPGWPVALFVGVRHEPDTRDFVVGLLQAGREVYLPTMDEGGALRMARLRAVDELRGAGFGLIEPAVPERDELLGQPRALVFVPGLAFDRGGVRLGHGKGHYDRWFGRAADMQLCCVGLCTDARVVDALPSGPHDRRMDGVLTSSGWVLQPAK